MFRRVIVVFYVLTCGFVTTSAQIRRALVIGLGEQEDQSWNKINGDKDIPFVIDMLNRAGYKENNIKTLVNKEATKGNIESAFETLINCCKLNDIIYIHYSGHRQRVNDLDGDEEDGWDESWIPYDAYLKNNNKDRGEKHLIDDEICKFLAKIRRRIGIEGKILVVVDACHSGSSSLLNEMSASYNEITTRGASIPFIISKEKVYANHHYREKWLTLSACKSYQFNQEMQSPKVGILSYAIYLLSKSGSLDMNKIEAFIKENKGPLPQTPQLTGEANNYHISDVLR